MIVDEYIQADPNDDHLTLIRIEKRRIPMKNAIMSVGIDSNAVTMWIKTDPTFSNGKVHHIRYDTDTIKKLQSSTH